MSLYLIFSNIVNTYNESARIRTGSVSLRCQILNLVHSTILLQTLMGVVGFEPTMVAYALDLKSSPFDHLGTHPM